jgi:hypothetical protein
MQPLHEQQEMVYVCNLILSGYVCVLCFFSRLNIYDVLIQVVVLCLKMCLLKDTDIPKLIKLAENGWNKIKL